MSQIYFFLISILLSERVFRPSPIDALATNQCGLRMASQPSPRAESIPRGTSRGMAASHHQNGPCPEFVLIETSSEGSLYHNTKITTFAFCIIFFYDHNSF